MHARVRTFLLQEPLAEPLQRLMRTGLKYFPINIQLGSPLRTLFAIWDIERIAWHGDLLHGRCPNVMTFTKRPISHSNYWEKSQLRIVITPYR